MTIDPPTRRRVCLAAVSCAALVLFCYAFLDRPIATIAHGFFPNPHIFVLVARHSTPLIALGVVVLGVATLAYFMGWKPHPNVEAVLRVMLPAAVAAAVAMCVKDEFKFAFGRTWPGNLYWHNPSWVTGGIYTFVPFHGGLGFESFPSGHTTVTMTIACVFWRAFPRYRLLWTAPVALLSVALVVTGVHWLSDVIAGAYLGAACGFGVAHLMGVKEVVLVHGPEDEATAAAPVLADEAPREPAE